MLTDDIKKAANYSIYLIIFIVALTWINHFSGYSVWLGIIKLVDNLTLFSIAVSILASLLVIVNYLHESSMVNDLNLSAYVARSAIQNRKKLDHLLESIPESIMIIDLEDKSIYFNDRAREIFNLPRDYRDWFYEERFPININRVEIIKRHLLAGQIWEDKSLIRIENQLKTFRHRIYPLSMENEPKEIIIISTDISELVEASKDAESANLSKSQFLANMTHELRTPMIGVLGSTDLLSHTSLNSEQYCHVDTIRECGEQLLNIINDILDLSKIDLGMDTLKPLPADLTKILDKTTAMVANSLLAKGLQMEMYIDPSLPPLLILDEQKFRQVLVNLLVNAIKFTSSGKIELRVVGDTDANHKDWLLISVQDTGIGIPEDKLDTIFGCFTQADNSSCREYGGAGLGLYICERLVRLMAGQIWVNSQEGMGATFAFRIPLKVPDIEEEIIMLDPIYNNGIDTGISNDFLPIRILLVEDNELNQKLITQMLLSYGYEVELASNGLECLHILERENFNLILMDMQMPIMDGYEATRIIRANLSWNHIPVIAITANAMSGDREKCLNCGCASYLAKPFKAIELVQEINTHLKTTFVPKTNTDPSSNQLIADLIPEFLAILEEMLEELRDSIQNRDMNAIQYHCHAIKGTAGMYGFIQISEIAALMEQACRDNQYPKVPQLFMQISKSYKQINTQINSDIVV